MPEAGDGNSGIKNRRGNEGGGHMGYKLGSGPVRGPGAVWNRVELLEADSYMVGEEVMGKDQTNRDVMELLQNTTKQSES